MTLSELNNGERFHVRDNSLDDTANIVYEVIEQNQSRARVRAIVWANLNPVCIISGDCPVERIGQ